MKEDELIRAWKTIRMPEDTKIQLEERIRLANEEAGAMQNKEAEPYASGNGRRSRMPERKKRIAVLAAAIIMVLGITAFAATGVISSWYSSSSAFPDYHTLPSMEQVHKDIGYDVELIGRFSNGYAFRDGRIVKNKLENEDNQTIEEFKSVDFRYRKGRDEVSFAQDRYYSESELSGSLEKTVKGVDLYYFSYVNKIVPPDYQLTPEDKRAEENGELVFSYGSDHVELITWQHVSWRIGEMHYELYQQVDEDSLSREGIIEMAEEVILK